MLAVSFSTMRNNLKSYCDKAVKENEDVIVTRKNEENVVLINLEKYNQFLKAVQNAEYLAKIDRGFSQMKSGKRSMMNKLWTDDGWADYLYWQSQDKKL